MQLINCLWWVITHPLLIWPMQRHGVMVLGLFRSGGSWVFPGIVAVGGGLVGMMAWVVGLNTTCGTTL